MALAGAAELAKAAGGSRTIRMAGSGGMAGTGAGGRASHTAAASAGGVKT